MNVKVKDIVTLAKLVLIAHEEKPYYGFDDAIELASKIINESTNDYEKGWHDALNCALEATNRDIDGYIARQKYISEDKLSRLQLAHNETALNLEREVEI